MIDACLAGISAMAAFRILLPPDVPKNSSKILYICGRCCHVDKQFAMAVILIIIGVGLTQLGEEVYLGAGVGTVAMASVWIVLLIVRDLKRR